MALFLGHIAFILQILTLSYGLVLLSRRDHKTLTTTNNEVDLYNIAGWVLVVFGVLGAICTAYYMIDYWRLNDFSRAYPQFIIPTRSF